MRARRGVSLFEAVIALTIVGLTAISALAAVGAQVRTAEQARRTLEVEALATERQVFMFMLTDRDLLSLPDSVAQGRFDYPMDEYTWATSSTPDATYPGLYSIKVDVYWNEGSYSLTAAQYRRPIVTRR